MLARILSAGLKVKSDESPANAPQARFSVASHYISTEILFESIEEILKKIFKCIIAIER